MEPWVIALICVIAVAVIVLGIVVFLAVRRHNQIVKSNQEANQRVQDTANGLAKCLGGNDNIVSIEQRRSRVVIVVNDISKVDKKEIATYLDSVMYMSNKITCVIGSRSEEFTKLLEENVGKAK